MNIKIAEEELKEVFKKIDDIEMYNSQKVLEAFQELRVSNTHFSSSTGYGIGDIGRDKIEEVFAYIFKAEDALVRSNFVSGTHALTVALFALLRPSDNLLSITGLPYDTLHPVIGITDNESSLKSYGINFDKIDLINNQFDYIKIEEYIKENEVKVVHIQRSIGYEERQTIDIESLEKVIKFIKNINKEIIIFVDNCYCEFCHEKEPTEVGADITVGSLIKNLGGGITSSGAYIVGKQELINLCAERLSSPGLGKDVGPSLGMNKEFLQGIYFAPSVVGSALKTKMLTSHLMKNLNIEVINDNLNDIVLGIKFNDKEKLINYVKLIQKYSAIDSFSEPIPSEMPGYDNDIIMASGSFIDGSSIELSCDGPIKEPYIAYQQGSLTYQYGKIALTKILENLEK